MACYICSEWELGKMTEKEAYRALGEVLQFETDQEARDHLFGLSERILDKENKLEEFNEQTDYLWDLDEDSECS
jgi:hypothetical protein